MTLEDIKAGCTVDANGCWLWNGLLTHNGYARVGKGGKRGHRVTWTLTSGPPPAGALLLHSCDVRRCCNPDHVAPGTAKDNTDDMMAKGRGWQPRLSGAQHPNFGKVHSPVTRARMSKAWEHRR